MATTIRLRRVGRKKQAHFRIVVTDRRTGPRGRSIERLGIYNPRTEPSLIKLDAARTLHWLREGAEPSHSVRSLLRKSGLWEQWHAGVEPSELEEPVILVGPPPGRRKTSRRPKPDLAAEKARAAEAKAAAEKAAADRAKAERAEAEEEAPAAQAEVEEAVAAESEPEEPPTAEAEVRVAEEPEAETETAEEAPEAAAAEPETEEAAAAEPEEEDEEVEAPKAEAAGEPEGAEEAAEPEEAEEEEPGEEPEEEEKEA